MQYREWLKENAFEHTFEPAKMTEEHRKKLYDFLEDLNDSTPTSPFKNRKCRGCAKAAKFTPNSPYKCDGCRDNSEFQPFEPAEQCDHCARFPGSCVFPQRTLRCASFVGKTEEPQNSKDTKSEPQYNLKPARPNGNYDAQLRAYEFLQKEFNMNKHDVKNALVDSAVRNMTGTLQINGARVPVRLTSLSETTGELPKIECDVLTPTKEMQQEEYCRQDVEMTHHIYGMIKHKHAEEAARMAAKRMLNSVYGTKGWRGPEIKDVIFNPPATIVFWKDGTKTVVKAWGEDYDPEKGLAMAIAKKALGNNHDYYNTFKKWLKKAPKQEEKPADTRTLIGKVCNVESTPDGLYARGGR